MASIKHNNIVRYCDAFMEKDNLHIVMEFAGEGGGRAWGCEAKCEAERERSESGARLALRRRRFAPN